MSTAKHAMKSHKQPVRGEMASRSVRKMKEWFLRFGGANFSFSTYADQVPVLVADGERILRARGSGDLRAKAQDMLATIVRNNLHLQHQGQQILGPVLIWMCCQGGKRDIVESVNQCGYHILTNADGSLTYRFIAT